MGLKRDLTVLAVMIIVLVSFTMAWSIGDLGTVWTASAVQYVDSPVTISIQTPQPSNFTIVNYQEVYLYLKLNNTSTSSQDVTIEVQPVDANGDLVHNSTTTITPQTASFTVPGSTIYYATPFLFTFDHIDRYLQEFLIIVTGPGYKMTWSLSSLGSSTASLAVVGYSTTTPTPFVPKVSLLNPPWTSQTLLQSQYYLKQVKTAFNPNWKSRFEIVAVVLGTDTVSGSNFRLYAYVYDGVKWNGPQVLGDGTGYANPSSPFDVAYEETSSRAIVVWNNKYEGNNARDLAYMIWDGTAWGNGVTYGSKGYINTKLSESESLEEFTFVRLEANPTTGSNSIGLAALAKTTNWVKAFVWNGSSWGNGLSVCTTTYPATTSSYQCFDLDYEYTSGRLWVVAANNQNVRRASFLSGTWSSVSTFTMGSNNMYWLILKGHKVSSSNRLMLVSLDSARYVYARDYSGSSWSSATAIDGNRSPAGVESATTRCVDGDWLPTGTTFLLVAGDSNLDAVSYKTWTTSGWSPSTQGVWTQVSISGVTDQEWVQVRTNLKNSDPLLLVGVVDDASDLTILRWTGSTLTSDGEFTPNSSATYEGFGISLSWP